MTETTIIHPVLLCGGSGTRLWPLSRKSYPKQFAALLGGESLFQASARRFHAPGFSPPLVVTADPFRFIVTEQLAEVGIAARDILIEPEAKNTAPAILAASLRVAEADPEALVLAAPSDHAITDASGFRAAVSAAVPAARDGRIVLFGITPTRAETGYGYLKLADGADPSAACPRPLERFVEKPDADRARQMVEAGNYLWNAGLFLFRADTMIEAFRIHAPDALEAVSSAVGKASADLGLLRLAPEPWAGLEEVSVDYAIMEKAEGLLAMPYSGDWSDLGGWEAVWQEIGPDRDGNVTTGPATVIDCRDSLLRSEAEGLELVGLGLRDVIAVAMPDAVLVAHRSEAQRVRDAVAALKEKGAPQAEHSSRDHRPWGWFEKLAVGERFQVKRIVVNPGGALSLQSHHHRAEHWIVVAGTAKVTLDGEERLVTENQSVYIPLGAVHRMENPGKVPMVLIEVQTGSYLGEDDIIRYEDAYRRD